MLEGLVMEIASIKGGFPKNSIGEVDVDGHRMYHESLMRSAQRQEEFWADLRSDLTKKGITVVLLVVIGLIVTGIGVEFKAFLAKLGAQ